MGSLLLLRAHMIQGVARYRGSLMDSMLLLGGEMITWSLNLSVMLLYSGAL